MKCSRCDENAFVGIGGEGFCPDHTTERLEEMPRDQAVTTIRALQELNRAHGVGSN